MANKPVDMSKLKQVLRLYKNGDMSNRKIAETVELDKNTVNKYINQAKKDSLSIDELLAAETVDIHPPQTRESAVLDQHIARIVSRFLRTDKVKWRYEVYTKASVGIRRRDNDASTTNK